MQELLGWIWAFNSGVWVVTAIGYWLSDRESNHIEKAHLRLGLALICMVLAKLFWV